MARFIVLLHCLTLSACAVGPDYRRPELLVPAAYDEAGAPGTAEDVDRELAEWWLRLGDARLVDLVERALRSNVELRIAEARVREARALRGVARADFWPQLDANAEAFEGSGSSSDLALGALDAFLEIDVFGRVRRSVEAADADLDASVEARRAVLLALVGEVTRSYVELRGFQGQMRTLRSNLEAQRETRGLTEAQLRVGLASDLDVERARAQVSTTAAELPLLEIGERESMHRLAVLLGLPPVALRAELSAEAPIPTAPPELLVGVPADLLRRRPDLGLAERELAAATARIGQAEADLYPRFALLGSVGVSSDALSDVFGGDGSFAGFGPRVSWPVFAGGRIRAQVQAQSARQEEALARYELTLLGALEEVENALLRHAREQVRRGELRDAVEANREASDLARRLYANGLGGFLDVLIAERVLFESESRLVESETAVSTSVVALYVALGGGWERAEALRLP